jgi:organic radical activating enzyme
MNDTHLTGKQMVILYGAGNNASDVYSYLTDFYQIVCLADKDTNKHGNMYKFPDGEQLPILALPDSLIQFPNAKLWIAPKYPLKYDIIAELMTGLDIKCEQILNYEATTKRQSCMPVEEMLVFIDGGIQTCCVHENVPVCQYNNSILNKMFLNLLDSFKNKISDSLKSNCVLQQCFGCKQIKLANWSDTRKIQEVNLISGSMCQFKCIYCNNDERASPQRQQNLERTLSLIEYLKEVGYITESTHFSIANGEITINPLRKMVYDTIYDYHCTFYTNAELYSEEIAEFLNKGNNKVNISLDAGTSNTFAKIKGKDCFDRVVNTIRKYAQCGEVELKYIILPKVNDNELDALEFVKIAVETKAKIILSRNSNKTDEFDTNIASCSQTVSTIVTEAKTNNLQVINIMNGFREQSQFEEQIAGLFSK